MKKSGLTDYSVLSEWCLHVNVSVFIIMCFIIQNHDCDKLEEKKCNKIYLFHIILMDGQLCNIGNRIVIIVMVGQLCNIGNRIVTITVSLIAGQLCNIGNCHGLTTM